MDPDPKRYPAGPPGFREKCFLEGVGELLLASEASEQARRNLTSESQYYLGRIEYLVEALRQRESSVAWRLFSPVRVLHALLSDGKFPSKTDWKQVSELARRRYERRLSPSQPPTFASKLLACSEGPVVIDCTEFSRCNHGTGISRVVENIGKYVTSKVHSRECVMSRFLFDIPVEAGEAFHCRPAAGRHVRPILGLKEIVLLDASWALMDRLRTFLPVARRLGIRVTTCIYDLIPLEFPQFMTEDYCKRFAEWINLAVEYSDNFICISESTAISLASHLEKTRTSFPRPYNIGYWHLGTDFGPAASGNDGDRSKLPSKYCLTVGSLAPHKNHHKVLDAMERLWKSGKTDLSLVVAGRSGHGGESVEQRISRHDQLGKRLFRLADPTDADLEAAYAGATLVAQASHAEGFGLPVVEAASHGKAMVLSDIPVFREIVSAGGFFFDPSSEESIAASILDCLDHGCPPIHVRICSWNESADRFIKFISSGDYPIQVLH